MASTNDFGGSKPYSRVKHVGGDDYEIYDAGQSDGISAGEFVAGWGAMVRARPRPIPALAAPAPLHWSARVAAVQARR